MPEKIINLIQSEEQKRAEEVSQEKKLTREEIQAAEKKAQAILKEAETVSKPEQVKIEQGVNQEKLQALTKEQSKIKQELEKLEAVSAEKKAKAVDLVISKILK